MYRRPGIFVEDISFKARSIDGVGTSTAAFIGQSFKGPVLEPTLVTTWKQFEEKFGGLVHSDGHFLGLAVAMFFRNQGHRAYVVRVPESSTMDPAASPSGAVIEGSGSQSYVKALVCLEGVDDINLVAMPGVTDITAQRSLIEHCERMKDRFAILDSVPITNPSDPTYDVTSQKVNLMSSKGYAALYFPWIKILDPVTGSPYLVPPSGAVAGIYARTDIERGVQKAPSGVPVIGAIDVEAQLTSYDHSKLDRIGVNEIRRFPGRGIMAWGARTISDDPLWKYVNVRRLTTYLERSIFIGTQWVVFEKNEERTWAMVRQSLSDFLTLEWERRTLQGMRSDQAFFVKCDRSMMTQNDLDNGRLIIEIGFAPLRPAEFLITRVSHRLQ